jgi:glycosyltransferase involved in cell wall biosynthesis
LEASETRLPDLTIIIPTKEEEGYIGRTLHYLNEGRTPTCPTFEIIVVDGGSRDGTVAEASTGARVITDSDGARQTIGLARNIGAAAARGELLFHTDADVIVPDIEAFLQRVTSEFEDLSVVAVTACIKPYPWASTVRDALLHAVGNWFYRMSFLTKTYFARGECQIVRRSAFSDIGGYSTRYTSGEDCDLFYRLRRCGRLKYLSDLEVYHSPRRFHQLGYLKVILTYVREWAWRLAFKRSALKEWPVVR